MIALLLGTALAQEVQVSAGLDRELVLQNTLEERYVVVEIRAPDRVERRPVHLAVAMDTSDSMYVGGKLDYAKQAAKALAASLGPGDTLSLVGFNTDAEVLMRQGPITNPARVDHVVNLIRTGGGTNLFGGMQAAFGELERIPDLVRRAIVLSDGQANVGPSGATSLADLAARFREQGIGTSALGLGLEFDRDTLMAISDAGGGRYHYVNDAEAVVALFQQELEKTAQTAALGVKVDLHMAPGVELVQVIGYEEWDGRATADGWSAFVGDVHAGETRKVVARVRLPPATTTSEVGAVTVSWPGYEQSFPLRAVASADPNAVVGSTNSTRAALVGKATAGSGMSSSVGYWSRGMDTEASRAVEASIEELEKLEEEYEMDFADEKANLEADKAKAAQPARRRALDEISLEALGYME